MTASENIVFDCPKCGQGIRTPRSTAGKASECPYCRAAINVPDDDSKTSPVRDLPPVVPPGLPPSSPAFFLPVRQQTCGQAVAGMVLGIISIFPGPFLGGPLFAIVGLVLSSLAMKKISKEPDKWTGNGMAIAGLTTSIVGLIIGLIVLLLFGLWLGLVGTFLTAFLHAMPKTP
jgi:hypothetical protein